MTNENNQPTDEVTNEPTKDNEISFDNKAVEQQINEDDPNYPLISVIVPCFNHGKYLRESVESLLNQTYKNLEIIIVNDGSTDETNAVATALEKEHPERIHYIEFSDNRGKWYALNTAIEVSKGVIITAQDADDISLPNRIDRQLETMKATNALHVLCGFHHCHSEEDIEKYKKELVEGDIKGIPSEVVTKMVEYGFNTNGINHYFTAEFETAGVSAMFLKSIWTLGIRFNPPNLGLRIAMSEDSCINSRITLLLRNTVVLAEKLYLYRRWTGNKLEEK